MAERRLNVEEAAARIGRSKATIYRWRDEGVIRFRSGLVDESALVAAEKAVRARRKTQHETRPVEVTVDGLPVGVVRYNPETGRIVGEIEPGLILAGLETRRVEKRS